MKNNFAKALKQLQKQLEAGDQPDRLLVDDQEYSLHYDQDYSGVFVDVWFRWPKGWFGVLDGDAWASRRPFGTTSSCGIELNSGDTVVRVRSTSE